MSKLRKYIVCCLLFVSDWATAFTADRLRMEVFHGPGYKVIVTYTIPGLREFREATVTFATRKEAEAFYINLARGADFDPTDPYRLTFPPAKDKPNPW
ncbi:MAG: hypothetical protein HRU19_06485 [Pseudobacteriovorax sp.]|nr:hypothetical protein [Pseudobacteriovorax sp.]